MFPAPPQLIEKPQDVQKLIDDSLVWECKATGKPKPSYRWMKNGENLESAEVRSAGRERVFRIEDKILLPRLRLAAAALAQMFPAYCELLNEECERPCTLYFQSFVVLFVQALLTNYHALLSSSLQHRASCAAIRYVIHFCKTQFISEELDCLLFFSLLGDWTVYRPSISCLSGKHSDVRAALIFCWISLHVVQLLILYHQWQKIRFSI